MSQPFEFSPDFTKRLACAEIDALVKLQDFRTEHGEFAWAKVGREYSVRFMAWQYNAPALKIETTITKPTIIELENAIIKFFEP